MPIWWTADVSYPRDQTHCRSCRKALRAGEFCLHESSPINAKSPPKYRTRIIHAECWDKEVAALWRKRRKEKR